MLTCPACGRGNPDGSSFCNACGADLAEPAAAEREYRKVVTLLFCDVVGSTVLGESTDPEALRTLLGRYFDEMKAIIERHGGTVEKFIGDAVMAVFGVPRLHEDDALRAVRAAVEMRDALPELGVEARIGVNTGEVVVGTAERLATGDAVNVAARLEQAAGAGEVLLGPETAALVRDAVETEELVLELKGKSEPLVAHRLVSLQAQAPGFARRFDAQLVGRERELRRLQEAFGQAEADGSCQLFTLLGTAGVGKSRLTAEFIGSLDGARVVRGRCLPYGEGITYWPVIEVLKQLPPARELDLDPAAVAAIEGLLGDEPAISSTEEIPWALRTLLESAAASAPVVVVFDDIHWAEPAFLDLIEHVADLSRAAPILLLCLARPELLERRPGWGGGQAERDDRTARAALGDPDRRATRAPARRGDARRGAARAHPRRRRGQPALRRGDGRARRGVGRRRGYGPGDDPGAARGEARPARAGRARRARARARSRGASSTAARCRRSPRKRRRWRAA